jgi:AcrR family transcriptional regulator
MRELSSSVGPAGATGAMGLTGPARARLTAEKRRAAVLETACAVFSKCGYHGTTTAEIARKAGVSEPILYRHFDSKRELYLACLDEAWDSCRSLWDEVVDEESDPALWVRAMGNAYLAQRGPKMLVASLWVQALTEASDDPEIRKFMRRQIREVHGYVSDVIRRSQAAGGILPDRDPSAEAWIFLSIGLLATVDRRLGGLLGDDMAGIFASRRQWMTGQSES